MSARRLGVYLCAGLLLLGAGRDLHAAPAPADYQRAVRMARQARAHYDAGSYKKAVAGYLGAYRIVNRPSLLFNIADCYERLGRLSEAVRYYRLYLKVCAPDKRPQVEKLIAAILRRPATVMVASRPRGAKVWVNEKLQAWPTPMTVSVPPGTVHLRVVRPGYRVHRQQVVARPGATLNLVVTLEKQRVVRPPPPPPPRRAPRPWERSAGFVELSGGLKKAVYQGASGQPQLNYSLTVSGGYGLRMGSRARLELGARLFLSHIDDGHILTLFDVSALVGLRVTLWRRLFAVVRAGVGLATLHGVWYGSFFFDGFTAADDVPGSYISPHLWASLGLGYRVWQRLSLVLTLAALDFVPPLGYLKRDAEDLNYIFRYSLHLGLLVEL